MTNGRAKGAAGELEVARLLEPWWRRLEPEARFIRTPGSGGWRHARGFRASCDLMPDPQTCRLFPFSLEVKRKEAWSEQQFCSDKPSPVWKWWAQCCKAAATDGLRPMLWFRKNTPRQQTALGLPPCWLVMIEASVHERLRLRGMSPPLVHFYSRATVVLTHAQTLWVPPRAFVRACAASPRS